MSPQKCCCFSLKTGSKIIGFWSTIGTPFYIYGLVSLNQQIIYIISYITPTSITSHDVMGNNYIVSASQNIGNTIVSMIIFKIFYLFFSMLLLIGLFKNNPCLMMPWLIIEPMRQVIFAIFAAYSIWIPINLFGLSTVNANSPLIAIPISVAIAAIIFMGLAFYYWRVVKTTRDQMRDSLNKIISEESPYYGDENTVPVVVNTSGNAFDAQISN